MKNFILVYAALAFLIALLPFWFLLKLYPLETHQWDYVITKYSQEIVSRKNKNPIDHIFLGGSEILAGIYPKKIKNAINLGVAFGRPMQSYYLLKEFLKNNPPPKAIFSTIPFALLDRSVFHEAQVKYGLYKKEDIFEIFYESKKAMDLSFQNRFLFYYKNFSLLFKSPFYYKSEIFNFLQGKGNVSLKKHVLSQIKKERGFLDIEYIYKNIFSRTEQNSFLNKIEQLHEERMNMYFNAPLPPTQIVYLQKMKKITEKYNIKLYFLVIPTRPGNDLSFYINSIKKLVPKYFLFVLPQVEKKYFADTYHLTRAGAMIMSDSIIKFISITFKNEEKNN